MLESAGAALRHVWVEGVFEGECWDVLGRFDRRSVVLLMLAHLRVAAEPDTVRTGLRHQQGRVQIRLVITCLFHRRKGLTFILLAQHRWLKRCELFDSGALFY